MKHKIPWTVTMPLITSYLILLLMSRKVEDNFSSLWSSWSIPQKKEVFVRWCLDCITTTLYFCFSGWSLCQIRRSQSHKFLLWLVQETWQTPTNHRPACRLSRTCFRRSCCSTWKHPHPYAILPYLHSPLRSVLLGTCRKICQTRREKANKSGHASLSVRTSWGVQMLLHLSSTMTHYMR